MNNNENLIINKENIINNKNFDLELLINSDEEEYSSDWDTESSELEFNWNDLPSVNSNTNEVKNLMGQLLRTSVSFRFDWLESLTTKWKQEQGTSWYTSLIQSKVDLNNTNTKDLILQLGDYFDNYLNWISSMISHSKSNINDVINLVETNQFSTFDNEREKNGVELTKKHQGSAKLDKLIMNSNSNSSEQIFEEMSESSKFKNQSGLGIFLNTLYHACRSKGGK